jgi:hypothetical protein
MTSGPKLLRDEEFRRDAMGTRVCRPRPITLFRGAVLAGLALLAPFGAGACARRSLVVSPAVLAAARPEVVERVRSTAYNYFRLANREWTARVCEMLGADLVEPIVQLHGDAHVEQFAYMKDAWGLDDFDDAARGPAAVDIVRFLGSLDLAARQRGWSRDRARLFDRFFAGYRRGLSDPGYLPPEPPVVGRHKAETPMSPESFLAVAEGKMKPMSDIRLEATIASMDVFSQSVLLEHPDLPDGFFRVVRAGALELGIGSAAATKVLIRLAGPSDDPADDVVLEAKAVRPRDAACLEQPSSASETSRIVKGSRQVGRLKHAILVAGPADEETIQGRHLSDWWIRSWDPTYHEVNLDDLQSVADLADIAYDAGVQLGTGAVDAGDEALRRRLAASIEQGEPRLRRGAEQLVGELLRGWRHIGHR